MPVCPRCNNEHPPEALRCPHCETLFLREWERPTTERITLDLSEYRELCRVEDPDEAHALIAALEAEHIKVRLVDFDPRTARVVQRIMVHDKHRPQAEAVLAAHRAGR